MAGYNAYQVQKGVHTALTGNSTLTALLGDGANGIMDNVQQKKNPTFPYVVYSGVNPEKFDSWDTLGSNVFIQISVFSNTGSRKETQDILSEVHATLHHQSITVSGADFLYCVWDGLDDISTDDSADAQIIRGVTRYKISTM